MKLRRQERKLVVSVNSHSSSYRRYGEPVVEWLQEHGGNVEVCFTDQERRTTRQRLAEKLNKGAVAVIIGGDGSANDGTSGVLAAQEHDSSEITPVVYIGAGGENDTARAVHGLVAPGRLARAAVAASRMDSIPIRTIRPFMVQIDDQEPEIGVSSASIGLVAEVVPWFEEHAKASLNGKGRSLINKLGVAVDCYRRIGHDYRMPSITRNDCEVPDNITTFLVMNDGVMAGTWRNLRARRAIESDETVVAGIDTTTYPRTIMFGARALSGLIMGQRSRHEEFVASEPIAVQVDGERLVDGHNITITKGDVAPKVSAIDVDRVMRYVA